MSLTNINPDKDKWEQKLFNNIENILVALRLFQWTKYFRCQIRWLREIFKLKRNAALIENNEVFKASVFCGYILYYN